MACSLLNFLMAEIYGSRKHFGICFNSSNPLISNLKWQTGVFIWKVVLRDKTEDASDYIATNNSEKILTPLDSRQSTLTRGCFMSVTTSRIKVAENTFFQKKISWISRKPHNPLSNNWKIGTFIGTKKIISKTVDSFTEVGEAKPITVKHSIFNELSVFLFGFMFLRSSSLTACFYLLQHAFYIF